MDGKTRIFNGQNFLNLLNKECKYIPKAGDYVFFTGSEQAIVTDSFVKNDYACGILSDCKKYLIPHGNRNSRFSIDESVFISNEDISPDSVFLAALDENNSCVEIKLIGNNNDTLTQEACMYVNAGLAWYLDEAYTCQGIPKTFEDINFDTKGVYDMTHHTTFCIDPIDAKDADDAISILRISDDVYEVGIHVADVTRFTKNDDLAAAALKSNTWYLSNSCLPMFPKDFATSVASFVAKKSRPSFSVVFKICNENIYDINVVLGKIKVDYSISYGYAEKLIEARTESDLDRLAKLTNTKISIEKLRDFVKLFEIALFLNKNRISVFDSIEFPNLDDSNLPCKKIIDSVFDEKNTHNSKMMVTEFMLHANHLVGDILAKSPEHLALFRACSSKFKLDRGQFKERIEFFRSIFKGKYSIFADLLGLQLFEPAIYLYKYREKTKTVHFPLGYPNYVHFTSPIRRFPDITVHYALKSLVMKNQSQDYV